MPTNPGTALSPEAIKQQVEALMQAKRPAPLIDPLGGASILGGMGNLAGMENILSSLNLNN